MYVIQFVHFQDGGPAILTLAVHGHELGIEAHFADGKLILHKPQSGHFEEPLYIVVGEQGEIDIAGRSLGRYQPADKLAKKRELIGEIISFFDL